MPNNRKKLRRHPKTIYRVQLEHEMPATYYYSHAKALHAFNSHEGDPESLQCIDPVAQCEAFEAALEEKQNEVYKLLFALTELMSITPNELFITRPEAYKALEAIRRYEPGIAMDTDRAIADIKEANAKTKQISDGGDGTHPQNDAG